MLQMCYRAELMRMIVVYLDSEWQPWMNLYLQVRDLVADVVVSEVEDKVKQETQEMESGPTSSQAGYLSTAAATAPT
jgi:hypothetical protein